MSELNRLFEGKLTENGDEAFTTTGDVFLDILFGTEYLTSQIHKNPAKYAHHFEMLKKEDPEFVKYFAMFIRDPRYGLGRRDLGRALFAALSRLSLSMKLLGAVGTMICFMLSRATGRLWKAYFAFLGINSRKRIISQKSGCQGSTRKEMRSPENFANVLIFLTKSIANLLNAIPWKTP